MTVVVGYIPTKEGRAALRFAAQESLSRGARLVVVGTGRAGRDDHAEAERFTEDLARVRADLDAAGIAHEEREPARVGEPAEDLIAVAEEVDASFIVIGLRRRTPIGKLILGSHAQRVLLEAPCPVVAVKAPRRESGADADPGPTAANPTATPA